MYCPAFILDLILLFSFAVQYHVTWCLSDTSLRWCNGTQVSCLLQREGTMRTHTHMTCPAVVQTKADCLCWHSWQQPSTDITQQQPTPLAFALTIWTWRSKHTFSVTEIVVVWEEGRQIKEKLSVRVRHRSTNTGTETEAYRQNTHSSRLG